jgi:hypothetical protein
MTPERLQILLLLIIKTIKKYKVYLTFDSIFKRKRAVRDQANAENELSLNASMVNNIKLL